MLFSALVAAFIRYNQTNRSARTVAYYQHSLAKFVERYGHLPALELRPNHVLQFKLTWHLVMTIQRLYRWASEENDLLPYNPMKSLRRPRKGARRRVLDRADLVKLLRAARQDFRAVLIAAMESAARPQEIRSLVWDDLRCEGPHALRKQILTSGRAYFSLADYKGRDRRADPSQPRVIPVSPRLGRMLWRLCRGRALTGLVFLTDQGVPWTRNSLRLRMRRLRQRVTIPEVLHGEKIVLYTLRHSSATDWAARGMQMSVLQTLMGHANIATTQRYVHLAQRQLMDTWKKFHERPTQG